MNYSPGKRVITLRIFGINKGTAYNGYAANLMVGTEFSVLSVESIISFRS